MMSLSAAVEQGRCVQVPETPYMDVLVDILLSILVKPSNLLRDVAKHVGPTHNHTHATNIQHAYTHCCMLDTCAA